MALDRGTRIYAAVLLFLVVGLAVLALYEPPEVARLNARLSADPQVAAFPYPFRVLRLEEGDTAVMSTPRSTAVPVERILGILFPESAGRSGDAPEFQAAQRRLAEVQTRARDLVLADPAVKRVRWVLDRDWLMRHGIQSPPSTP